MMTLFPSEVHEDSTGALIVLQGPPGRAVTWTLTGPGTLTPITSSTDALGRAAAKYVPASGTAGEHAIVEASYGA